MSFNPRYDNLLAAVKDATNTGIRVNYINNVTESCLFNNYALWVNKDIIFIRACTF